MLKSDYKEINTQVYRNEPVSIGQAARLLGVGIGQNNLFKFLKEKKILKKNNLPYEHFVECGYFKIIEETFFIRSGQRKTYYKTLVCKKGLEFIRGVYNEV